MTIPMVEQESQEAYAKKFELVKAMAQLDSKEKEMKSSKGYGKAYFWSVALPPMGIYYFVKYLFFMGGDKENVKAGVISLILTIASLLISFWSMAFLFGQATSGTSPDFQMLKDLAIPDNQKKLLELYK